MLVEELEQALQVRWDRETLDVYADALQAAGDPRGALIALALAGTPEVPRIRERRAALVDAWLAGFALDPDSHLDAGTGFIRGLFRTQLGAEAFMQSHVARYLRRVSVDGPRAVCEAILGRLAENCHPWCVELEIQIGYTDWNGPPVARDVIDRVEAAMPAVTMLRLHHATIERIPASVKKLELHYTLGVTTPQPYVEELVLNGLLQEPPQQVAACIACFPALRRLDLGENEDRLAQVFAILDELAAVRTLRLPSLRTPSDVERVRALLRRVPEVEIEIARTHRPLPLIAEGPRLRIAKPVPCGPSELLTYDDLLRVTLPTGHTSDLLTHVLAYNTETYFEAFSSEQQAALTALWTCLDTLGATPIGFPGAAMARVAETMMLTDCDSMIGISGWDEIERALAKDLSCSVLISRP